MRNLQKSFIYFAVLTALTLRSSAQAPTPQLWYWHHSYLTTDQAVTSSEALIDQAVADGYTGVAFWDSSFYYVSDSFWPAANVARLQTVMQYAASKGLKVMVTTAPFGYSNEALATNPNLAEAQRVIGTQYQVDPTGTQLQIINSFPGLLNGGFESGAVDWFDLGDPGTGVDTTVAHTGNASALISGAPFNSRLRQLLPLTPWRQYHLRLFYKTSNFGGVAQFAIMDAANFSINRLQGTISTGGNAGWTELDYTFNSQGSTQAWFYLGVWGGHVGDLWLDDISIEETGLVYVARRDGAPLNVYDPNNPNTVYQEGVDYNYISDPEMAPTQLPFTDLYHTPPTVTLPAGTHLSPGQIVAIDSYAAFPSPLETEVSMCLTSQGVLNWQTQNAKVIQSIMPAEAGVLMSYDEIRQMNSCQLCKAKNMTPGQLLAWSVGQSVQIYQSVMPNSALYIWSDMFDPYANAVNNYFSVEGDLSGSWTGVASNITIMNWNLSNLTNSLTWFSGQNPSQPIAHQQIIAGYFDSGDGTAAATSELTQASGIPGVVGLMYTSWYDDYSQLANFANAVRAGWTNYLNSVGGVKTNVPTGWVNMVSSSSGKCLDVTGISTAPAAPLQQWGCWGGNNQKFQFTPVSGGYEITVKNSGLQLDVAGGPAVTQDGAQIIQWPYWGGSNEIWNFHANPDGSVSVTALNSGKCLSVAGSSPNDGAPVQQWTCNGGLNQNWQLVPAQ
jgi:hypothetical protein